MVQRKCAAASAGNLDAASHLHPTSITPGCNTTEAVQEHKAFQAQL